MNISSVSSCTQSLCSQFLRNEGSDLGFPSFCYSCYTWDPDIADTRLKKHLIFGVFFGFFFNIAKIRLTSAQAVLTETRSLCTEGQGRGSAGGRHAGPGGGWAHVRHRPRLRGGSGAAEAAQAGLSLPSPGRAQTPAAPPRGRADGTLTSRGRPRHAGAAPGRFPGGSRGAPAGSRRGSLRSRRSPGSRAPAVSTATASGTAAPTRQRLIGPAALRRRPMGALRTARWGRERSWGRERGWGRSQVTELRLGLGWKRAPGSESQLGPNTAAPTTSSLSLNTSRDGDLGSTG